MIQAQKTKPGLDLAQAPALRLAEFLPYRLSVLSNTLSRSIAQHYDEAFGLTIWQWRCMAVLGETTGLTASEIAAKTAMDKVAVSRALAGLEADGHVVRRAHASDGRSSVLELTDKGDAVYRRVAGLAAEYERNLLEGLSQRDVNTLMALLDRLASAASPDTPLW